MLLPINDLSETKFTEVPLKDVYLMNNRIFSNADIGTGPLDWPEPKSLLLLCLKKIN